MQDEREQRATAPDAEMEEPTRVNGEAAEPVETDTGADEPEGELARARSQAAEYEDRWKRSAAEFQNFRRRTEQERVELLRGANGRLILDLLPVLDDLERALANVPAEATETPWVEGVRLVERKFRGILERQGIQPIAAVGQQFDPSHHEAVGGSGETVIQELQRGYTLHGRVLRPAMVVVGEGEAEPAAVGTAQRE